MQQFEQETDFDKHLDRLENSEGEVFFFGVRDNPARFQQVVVDAVLEKEPPEVLLIFHRGCGEKKSRSIARSVGRGIATALERPYSRTHIFILPSELFLSLQRAMSAALN